MKTTEWQNCYPSSWKGVIIPEAMAHPAKYSNKLIRRIYEHMIEMGWLKPGDKVLDPFGGVALGALDAMRLGLRWTGIELEAKFHDLGSQNIELWNTRYGNMPKWGSATLVNGDSRRLMELLPGTIEATVSSPPYEDSINSERHGIDWDKTKKDYPGRKMHDGRKKMMDKHHSERRYGVAAGQLGAMTGDFKAALSSPPYAETDVNYRRNGLKENGKEKYERPYMQGQDDHYGSTDGQLGAMKADGFDAAISSPPFESAQVTDRRGDGHPYQANKVGVQPGRTPTPYITPSASGQLGNMTGNFDAAISSPPFLQSEGGTPEPKPGGTIDERLYKRHAAGNKSANGYGTTDGQLSSMEDGCFDAAISSPPYADSDQNYKAGWKRFHDGHEPLHENDIQREAEYGTTDGQLSAMPANDFDASVSSPPYAETRFDGGLSARENGYGGIAPYSGEKADTWRTQRDQNNLGNNSLDDFWLAARAIVEQVYQALEPGGHAVWVVKDYVKNKQIVPFSDQWRQLCEAVGFTTEHEHHAMLVHHKGTQHTLEGGTVERKTESKSFFRRLAEKKGSPRIDWETIYCMTKL